MKRRAAFGSFVFLIVAPGIVAGVGPWLITRWASHDWSFPARALGAVTLATGILILLHAFVRFVVEGIGTPAPVAPTQRLVVGGAYRYVRNPMYLAVAAVILGQALLLGQAVLLLYACLFLLAVVAFVHEYEEPTLAGRFGEEYELYRHAVPAWRPRRRPWTDGKPQADYGRRTMIDTEPQTADGKVLWHFLMTLDGFVAGPNHDMGWMTGISVRPGLHAEYIETTGAVLAGRSGFDSAIGDSRPYGGAWQGPIFVLTHHPEDAAPAEGITFLSCPVEEAVQIALDAAGGKNVEVFSPTIGRQLLEQGLIDEIDLHIAPILLGQGIRLYDNPGGEPVRLELLGDGDPSSAVNLRYRPSFRA